MKLKILFLNKTALHVAVQKENAEIVRNLLKHQEINVNDKLISNSIYFISFH